MKESTVQQEFERIEKYLFDNSNWHDMTLTKACAKSLPRDAGVYMLFENGKPVYVGESGSISGRITDMLDSRHHTIRRSLGEKRFSHVSGYIKATSKRKHPEHIEDLINETLSSFKICALPIKIGRKEFEEYVFPKYVPELNRTSKRGTKNT
jgi:hypothetical protein